MKFKKYHRKFPESRWDYRAVSTKIVDNRTKEIIYYTLVNKGKRSSGVEIYSGENYIIGSNVRSQSISYSIQSLPEK